MCHTSECLTGHAGAMPPRTPETQEALGSVRDEEEGDKKGGNHKKKKKRVENKEEKRHDTGKGR